MCAVFVSGERLQQPPTTLNNGPWWPSVLPSIACMYVPPTLCVWLDGCQDREGVAGL